MKNSPLRLERHWFSKVVIEAQPDGKVGAANVVEPHVEIIPLPPEQDRRFQVTLMLKLLPGADANVCYTGAVEAVGVFQVADDWAADKVNVLVEANGPAVLLGAIRELICNITARGPWPMLALTTFSFVKPKPKAPAKEKEAAETSKPVAP